MTIRSVMVGRVANVKPGELAAFASVGPELPSPMWRAGSSPSMRCARTSTAHLSRRGRWRER